jgi:hypothetical protein
MLCKCLITGARVIQEGKKIERGVPVAGFMP